MNTGNNVALNIPAGQMEGRIVLGNSVYGRHSWSGTIYGLAMYEYVLTDEVIKNHNTQWRNKQDFTFAKSENPYLLFLFNEKSKAFGLDYSRHNIHLEIPSVPVLPERECFVLPSSHFDFNQPYLQDVVINFIGFLPFGYILVTIIYGYGGIYRQNSMLIVIISGFILSFSIEFLQSWMPSRSSSLLDLSLNTAGTFLGAQFFVFFQKEKSSLIS